METVASDPSDRNVSHNAERDIINMADDGRNEVDVSSFMEEVQKYPYLYNKSEKDYKNKIIKLNAWRTIGNKFKLSAEEAEKKFKNTRTSYGRYLKRLKTIPSGSGRNAVPNEFSKLAWLQTYIFERSRTITNYKKGSETSSNLDTSKSDSESGDEEDNDENTFSSKQVMIEDNIYSDSEPQTPLSGRSDAKPSSPKEKGKKTKSTRPWARKKKNEDDIDKALLQTATSLTQHLQKNQESQKTKQAGELQESEDSLFLKSLIPRMGKLSPRSKALLRMQMEQLFFQAEFPNPSPSSAQFEMHQSQYPMSQIDYDMGYQYRV